MPRGSAERFPGAVGVRAERNGERSLPMLDVCLPGTGGTVPRLDRFLACCYMRFEGRGLLIDCGEGTQLAVKKAGFRSGRSS